MDLVRDYSIVIEGESYDLPKRTVAIAKKFDEFNNLIGNDVKMHYKALEIIESLLGKAAIEAIFKTTSKDDIDIVDSVLVLKAIDGVYLKPLKDFEEKEALSQMDKIKEMGDSVAKITNLANFTKAVR